MQNVSSNILSSGVRLLKNRAVVISGFQHEVAENCTLLGCYAASSGNLLPVFQDNVSLPSAGFKNPKPKTLGFFNLQDGTNRLS